MPCSLLPALPDMLVWLSSMETPTGTISAEAMQRLLDSRQQFLSFIAKRVGSNAAAEDILQSAFLRSIEKGGAVRDDENVVAWFYRMLRNAIIDHYRRNASASRAERALLQEVETGQQPEKELRDEVCQCVAGLLGELKPEYREAIQVVDIEEGSLSDLARKAEISSANAAVRVHRAREALRKQVRTTCGACATHGCVDCRCHSQN